MPPDDVTRVTFSLSALGGAAFWGLCRLGTTLLARQKPSTQELVLAGLNVAAAMMMGALAAFFLGPALSPLVPLESLREPHALGFGIGFGCWEAAPILLQGWGKLVEAFVARKTEGGAP